MSSASRLLFVSGRIVCLVLLLLLLIVCFRWMLGDFYGERIAHSIEVWSANREPPSKDVLDTHLAFSDQALNWSPGNPRYKELQARLMLMQLQYLPNNEEMVDSLQQIASLHRIAATERPQWPFSWANLAYIKSILGQHDDEYEQALENLMAYGPYEAGALQRGIRSGLFSWQALSSESKERFYQVIANAIKINPRMSSSIKQSLLEKDLLDQVCESTGFHSDASKKKLCS